jgi:sensor domain CHASE-containing protein
MKKLVVYGTADGKFPEEYMEPEIFSTDNCDGMQIYDNQHGGIAVL